METEAKQARRYTDLKSRTISALVVVAFYIVYILLSFFSSERWVVTFIPSKITGIVFFVLGFISLLMVTVILFFACREITNLFFEGQKSKLIWTTCVMFVLLYVNSLYYLISANFFNAVDDEWRIVFGCFVGLVFLSGIISYVANTIFVAIANKKHRASKNSMFWYPFLTTITTLFLIAFLYVSVIHEWTTIMLLILIPTFSDVFGYFVGCKIGKHKLTPNISPNKSWEGLTIGSYLITLILISAIIACFVYADRNDTGHYDSHLAAHVFLGCQTCSFAYEYNVRPYFWIIYISCTFLFITISFLGDLFFSYVKRLFKIKDFSNLLPGHGGILDRIDSMMLLFIFYFLITIILQASTTDGILEAKLMWFGVY